ncbi:unnamed protein product [Colias eurytheme]|nr:unnamed protein product [Colias eurytheme]
MEKSNFILLALWKTCFCIWTLDIEEVPPVFHHLMIEEVPPVFHHFHLMRKSFAHCIGEIRIQAKNKKKNYPPHCTRVTKDTDYASRFKMDYPVVYIVPGQQEAYQKLYCINPPAINKAVTVVCDWAAPPLVQFTLGDEYMHVVRQDPSHSGVNSCLSTLVNPYVYKFGNNYGTTVQVIEGTILPFVYQTYRNIHIPDGMSVTYVEVQVHSLSSPKVDYDNDAQQVSIAFSITQLSEDSGNVVQILEGSILPLQYQTYKDIKIPEGMDVSYIEVRVFSLSPPKVDYDSSNQQVSIAFSYTQVSVSKFKITVKAVPNVDHIEEKSMKKL